MSITGFPDSDWNYKKSTQWRNDSGELDVFEATMYYSSGTQAAGINGAVFSQKTTREDRQVSGGRRMSFDMPFRNLLPSQSHRVEKQIKEKKYKQPNSPGGRLASFLNSLFNQTASKKKKSKSTTQSVKDEEESPGGWRKRRSSVSHFRSASNTDSKSMYSSSSSGFRTPPPYANTPAKICKDLKSHSDHRQVVSLSKYNNGQVSSIALQDHEVLNEKRNMDLAWLDEKFKFIDGLSEKKKNSNVRRADEIDDGGESDSSSDLFELENYDLGVYSSGLPVYETTHMENIKRGAPISNGPF